jgi:hypothetical protein
MKRAFVRLSGGLGNQLFQLSAAFFALNSDELTNVVLDTRFLSHYEESRDFGLGFMLKHLPNVKVNTASNSFPALASRLRFGKVFNSSIGSIAFIGSTHQLRMVQGKPIRLLVLDGYFQDPNICFNQKIRTQLYKILYFEFLYLRVNLNIPSAECTVSIHIRRGDFVTSQAAAKVFKTVSLDYYRAAVRSYPSSSIFLVFCDDPSVSVGFAKEIDGINVASLGLNLTEEFMLMALCDHHIIANSTFSWWASQLGDPRGKRITAPRNWYFDSVRSRTNPLILPNFELID